MHRCRIFYQVNKNENVGKKKRKKAQYQQANEN